jgi:phosphatidylglycerophosphatase A
MSEKSIFRPPLIRPEILFLSVFGLGFSPKAPGTICSLAMLPFLFILSSFRIPYFFILPLLSITTLVACFIAEHVQKKYSLHDPQWIVVDEALGMLTAWCFYTGEANWRLGLLFGLFRFFDIVKIWPASYFDKKVKHGAGTILDDIVSGIMAGLVYRLVAVSL